MATTSLQSLHQPFLHRRHRHRHHSLPLSEPPSPFPIKPTHTLQNQNLTLTLSNPLSPLTPSSLLTPAAAAATSSAFDALAHHLSSGDFRQADEETRRLLIVLAGDAAQQRGYVFFSEVRFISADDLQAIDELWRRHSGGRFGYSVQKRIWEKKARRDFTSFFVRVGWMKKLDTEVQQYNYRSFPTEFIWELSDDTPEGHLPLTNALRGTQLLASILTHPAFDGGPEEEGEVGEVKEGGGEKVSEEGKERPKFTGRSLKPDYSF